jgi:carbamoyltransferase
MKIYILGISAFYHDSAAALLCDGEVLAAAQEERFSRIKNDPQFPSKSIEFVLKYADISMREVDYVVYYDKPFLTFERLIASYLSNAPRGFKSFLISFPVWIKKKLFLKKILYKELLQFDKKFSLKKILFSEHHLSHAAGSFYSSCFDEAIVFTVDAVGEWATTSVAIGNGKSLKIEKEIRFPHSLGLLYSAFTYYLGFKVNEGEYKLMGLAPYGKPIFVDKIKKHLIDIKSDGTFRLNLDYFDFVTGLKMTNKLFDELFEKSVRDSQSDFFENFHADIAASIQVVTEEILLLLTRNLAKEYKIKNLCLSGGVALNCVANGKLLDDGSFENIWVQPSPGDAGAAIGCALAAWHIQLDQPRNLKKIEAFPSQYLGPKFSNDEIMLFLDSIGSSYSVCADEQLFELTADALANGKIVGWFQGRMEFGARALGNRSILADPRNPEMQKKLNLKIKFREGFRPFAPVILSEMANEWFEIDRESPYMLFVRNVLKVKRLAVRKQQKELTIQQKLKQLRSKIPAVTHINYSARVQTIQKTMNPKFHSLISSFNQITGCPILVNTSMNVRGEPIVCTPSDAYKLFMSTGLDIIVIENCILYKNDQFPKLPIQFSH